MKILIIGCGYVGSEAARYWKAKKFSITVASRSQERLEELQKIADHVILTERYSPEFFASILDSHQAILMSTAPAFRSPEVYREAYLDVAVALARGLTDNPIVKKVFYTSSTGVYGDHAGMLVDETMPAKAENPCNEILIKTEQALLDAANPHLNVCIFRLGGIYGPGRLISDRISNLKGHSVKSSGHEITNLIHLKDIVKALDFALDHDMRGIFNLCNDIHIKRKELYDQICAREGIPAVQFAPEPHLKSGKIVSNAKIKSLGFAFDENDRIT